MTRTTPNLAPPPNLRTTPAEELLAPIYDLACNRPTYTAGLGWKRVSNLEPSDPEAEILPLGYRCLNIYTRATVKRGTFTNLYL
ncbi:hypothetical protein AVEN_7347-1 [Araneus ventricosus]|uniref:Uncharacterized protein n=1 Tax=Araneus ventricosus TaxID=182803 RepID=A0A4Y2BQ78_ARAVE|nr:hypothetical protein AVEN_7347-1 [Araneus ventricosus]